MVLSNNDGCIVARNRQAKALGIPGFGAYFKIAAQLQQHGVAVFSSNYELYGDLSQRVMNCLRAFSPEVEIYSIDEAFVGLEGFNCDLLEYGRAIRRDIWRRVRIPVSVGIAPTKTLAKLANQLAKQQRSLDGVCLLDTPYRQQAAMKQFPIASIWGVGRQLAKQLHELGLVTAWDLASQPPAQLGKRFSINMERTVRELRGDPCLNLDQQPPAKQQIYSTRSFGERVYDLEALQQAVSCYASRAMEKLRLQASLTARVQVFIQTSRYDQIYYSRSACIQLPYSTNDTRLVVQHLRETLPRLFKSGLPYYKAGVGLLELSDESNQQLDLLQQQQPLNGYRLMTALDRINQQYPGSLFLASNGIHRPWQMKRIRKSPSYTTRWKQLPVVK